jgi:hypothetical protein
MDVFLAYHYEDEPTAEGLTDTLSGRGLIVGDSIELWPQMRLLPRLDQGLVEARHAIVLISPDFLLLGLPRKELDGLTNRRKVVCVLLGIEERDVAEHSPRLATAAIPGHLSERIVSLLRSP